MWTDYFKHIKLINLAHRTDRLQSSTRILNEYSIPFDRVEAIYNKDQPCVGLVDTIKQIMFEAIVDGAENILIFEDDLKPMVAPVFFNSTMDVVVSELPKDWDMLYLGCNPSGGFSHWESNTLLGLRFGYNTHAVAYSRKCMEYIVSQSIHEPIDNFLVREYQKKANIYQTFPLLFSQEPGFSDIGGQPTDWTREIVDRYREQLYLLNPKPNTHA